MVPCVPAQMDTTDVTVSFKATDVQRGLCTAWVVLYPWQAGNRGLGTWVVLSLVTKGNLSCTVPYEYDGTLGMYFTWQPGNRRLGNWSVLYLYSRCTWVVLYLVTRQQGTWELLFAIEAAR